MSARILIVDDDRAFRVSTAALLRAEGHDTVDAETGQEAVDALRAGGIDLVLLDLRMPGLDGIAIVEVLRQWGERLPILMISGFGTIDVAVRALHAGADDFLTKPIEPALLAERVAALLELRPVARPAEDGDAPGGLVGRSNAMREVYRLIRQVAPTEATVLITGETGTGKELTARAIHALSERAHRPFVGLNCAALAEGVLESELFGHVRGAFTGAVADRPGVFRAAQGGTLFLDEIGDISPGAQRGLLRALQEREVTPVGATAPVRVDVRVVAATNRDLADDVGAGRFRADLLYRLDVFRIHLPPLRERRLDIPLLVEHFLGAAGRARGAPPAECSPLAQRMLQAYDWPGNVRELLSVLESARIRAGTGRIQPEHLRPEVRAALRQAPSVATDPADEAARIRAALVEADGARARAATILGIGRTTLWRKMREHGLLDGQA